MTLNCATLPLLLLLVGAASGWSDDWQWPGTQARVNFTRADLEVTYGVGGHGLVLRAFRTEPFNDSACRAHYAHEADRRCMRWASLGYPQLAAVPDVAGGQLRARDGTQVKAFFLSRSDFAFDLAVLSDDQRRRLMQAARKRYGFVPTQDQFVPLPLSSLHCVYPLEAGNLTGAVADFNMYPLRVEFQPDVAERRVLDADLRTWRERVNSSSRVESWLDLPTIRCSALAGEHRENRTLSMSAQTLVKLTMTVCGAKPSPARKMFVTPQQLELLTRSVYETYNVSNQFELTFHDFYVKFVDELRQANVIGPFVQQNVSEVLPHLSNYSMRCGWEIDDEGSYVPVRCSAANLVRDLRQVLHLEYGNRSAALTDIVLREAEIRRLSNDALLSVEKPDEFYYLGVIHFGSDKRFSKMRKSWSNSQLHWKLKLEQLNRLGDIAWDVDMTDNSAPLYPRAIKVAQWMQLARFHTITFKSITHRPHAARFSQNFTVSVQLMTVRQLTGSEEPASQQLETETESETATQPSAVSAFDTRIKTLEARLETLEAQLRLNVASQTSNEQVQQLQTALNTLESRLTAKENSTTSRTMASMQVLLDTRYEQLQSNLSALHEKLERTVRERTHTFVQTISELNNKVSNATLQRSETDDGRLNGTVAALDSLRTLVDYLLSEHNNTYEAFNNYGDQLSVLFGDVSRLERRVNESLALTHDHWLLSATVDRLGQTVAAHARVVNTLEWTLLQMRNNLSAAEANVANALQRVATVDSRADQFDNWLTTSYGPDSDAAHRLALADQFLPLPAFCFRNWNATFQTISEAECAWKCLLTRCPAFSVIPLRTGRIQVFSCLIATAIDRTPVEVDKNCTSYILKGTADKFGAFYRAYQLVDSNSIVTHSDQSQPECVALCRNSPPCSAASYNSVTRACKMTLCGNVYVQPDANWNTFVIAPAKLEDVDVPYVSHQWALTETCDSASNIATESFGSYVISSIGTDYRNSSSPYLPNSTYLSGRKVMGEDGSLQNTHLSINLSWRDEISFPYAKGITIFFYAYFDSLPKRSAGSKVCLVELRTSSSKEGHIIYSTDTKQLEVELFHDSVEGSSVRYATTFTVSKTLQVQKWIYFAFSYDPVKKTASIVIDGTLYKPSGQMLANADSDLMKWNQMLIGTASDGEMAFVGRIYCLKLFTQALDAQQARSVAETCIGGQIRVLLAPPAPN